MSADETNRRSRRTFLRQTTLMAAGACAAGAIAPGQAGAATGRKCSDINSPLKDIAGKVAVVTGGSSGIGLGIVKAFVGAGMQVIIADRNEERTQTVIGEFATSNPGARVHGIRVDVTDRDAMEKAADESVKVFGKVHVLVNNAGVVIPPTVAETSYKDWDWLMNVNLNGVFNGIHVFLPLIQGHGEGGHVISTASALGLVALKGQAAYIASKYAVVGLMESLHAELQGTNIGASVFCPGLVASNIGDNSRKRLPEGTQVKVDPAAAEQERKVRSDPELAMDPVEVGRLVLRGMRTGELYILTHPEYEPVVRERNAALLAAFPSDLHPTAKREQQGRDMAKDSIYRSEIERTHCGRRR